MDRKEPILTASRGTARMPAALTVAEALPTSRPAARARWTSPVARDTPRPSDFLTAGEPVSIASAIAQSPMLPARNGLRLVSCGVVLALAAVGALTVVRALSGMF
jgi:hypothetical protein